MNALETFARDFHYLTEKEPFPWQAALYERFVGSSPDSIPKACNIPTGLGKTMVVAIWLLALKARPREIPRRLVYVVNRRTVVDQTTNEVEQLRKKLQQAADWPAELRNLALSTLRGQFADNREWSADPSRPAVICGTVDMIGSRLLFSGYGVGRNTKSHHAGLLGQDSLIVHDEAHLEPAFQRLLQQIEHEQTSGRFPDFRPLRVMELTATSRGNDGGALFTLTKEDKSHPEVVRRIQAPKALALHSIADEKKLLADELSRLALVHEASGSAVLVFARTIEIVAKVVAELPKDRTRQLTGIMRGLERERLTTDPLFGRFLPEAKGGSETVYLVCTSAGEVGVNISADHLVCDLSTFESMAQRFGRVNRFGLRADTRIDVVYPAQFEAKEPLTPARERTLDLLKQLNRDASPQSLSDLSESSGGRCARAFAPEPEYLPATDILFDAWALTSITGKLPGRPSVEPFLHGVAEWEPPETRVAWREEVGVMSGDLLEEYDPTELLEAYPLKPHELLADRTDRIWKELKVLAGRFPDRPVWIVDSSGAVEPPITLNLLAQWDKTQAEARLANKTVLLAHDVGGLTETGVLDAKHMPGSQAEEQAAPISNDVADVFDSENNPLRRRLRSDSEGFEKLSVGLRLLRRIDLPAPDDDEDAPVISWCWFERPMPAENSRYALAPVLWQTHTDDVIRLADQILACLGLDPRLQMAIRLAARFHDLGKLREVWQAMIGRPARLHSYNFAKSGRSWRSSDGIPYRHEFGSLLDLPAQAGFAALDDDLQDLVSHLVAAHHGMARPHFELDQMVDRDHPDSSGDSSSEVPRRFARLQRKYGRWGLAYLESLLKAADWHASAHPSAFFQEATP